MSSSLVEQLAARLGIHIDDAADALSKYVQHAQTEAHRAGAASLPGLGELRRESGTYHFIPDAPLQRLANHRYGGMEALSVHAEDDPIPEAPEAPQAEDLPPPPPLEHEAPAFEEDLPPFEEELPAFEESPPAFEDELPAFEETPPAFEDELPAFEETPPPLLDDAQEVADVPPLDLPMPDEEPLFPAPPLDPPPPPEEPPMDVPPLMAEDETFEASHYDDDTWSPPAEDDTDHPLGPLPPPDFEEADYAVVEPEHPPMEDAADPEADAPGRPPPMVPEEPAYETLAPAFDAPDVIEPLAAPADDADADDADAETDAPEEEAEPAFAVIPPQDPPTEEVFDLLNFGAEEPTPADAPPEAEPEASEPEAPEPEPLPVAAADTRASDVPKPPRGYVNPRRDESESNRMVWVIVGMALLAGVVLAFLWLKPSPPADPIAAVPPPVVTDTTAAPADTTAVAGPPTAAAPQLGGIDRNAGGFSLIVASETSRGAAEAVGRRYLDLGQPVDILAGTSEGVTRYRVAVGQFPSSGRAETVRRTLGNRLPNDAWVLRIRAGM